MKKEIWKDKQVQLKVAIATAKAFGCKEVKVNGKVYKIGE